MKRWRWISICGFEGMCARVAQWWSIALPRRGSRVRIPSRALKEIEKRVIRWMALFSMFKPCRARTVRSIGSDLFIAEDIMCDQNLFVFSEKTSNFWFLCYNALLWKNPMYKTRWMRWRKKGSFWVLGISRKSRYESICFFFYYITSRIWVFMI